MTVGTMRKEGYGMRKPTLPIPSMFKNRWRQSLWSLGERFALPHIHREPYRKLYIYQESVYRGRRKPLFLLRKVSIFLPK